MKFIEIVDPRGNSYKFVMDMNMKSGEDVMLPRKGVHKHKEKGVLGFLIFKKKFLFILIENPKNKEEKIEEEETEEEPVLEGKT